MGMFDSMHISASGLAAERLRMDVISENLANVNSTRGPDGKPYRRHEVVFKASDNVPGTSSSNAAGAHSQLHGVEAVAIVEDPSELRAVHDPANPDADENGYVYYPNVNPVTEMVDMMTATRAYEANVTAMNAAKNMALKALDILR
ncbi:MAG: flagellar basal-body rod protein FlgC [Thermoleophilia bacterium]|nr:flagellar basal-body rod protein FlgC [Thermoleophilia bacterium]